MRETLDKLALIGIFALEIWFFSGNFKEVCIALFT